MGDEAIRPREFFNYDRDIMFLKERRPAVYGEPVDFASSTTPDMRPVPLTNAQVEMALEEAEAAVHERKMREASKKGTIQLDIKPYRFRENLKRVEAEIIEQAHKRA